MTDRHVDDANLSTNRSDPILTRQPAVNGGDHTRSRHTQAAACETDLFADANDLLSGNFLDRGPRVSDGRAPRMKVGH